MPKSIARKVDWGGVAATVQRLIDAHEHSVNAAAKLFGVSQPQLFKFIKRKVEVPHADLLVGVARAYGVPLAELIGLEPVPAGAEAREKARRLRDLAAELDALLAGDEQAGPDFGAVAAIGVATSGEASTHVTHQTREAPPTTKPAGRRAPAGSKRRKTG